MIITKITNERDEDGEGRPLGEQGAAEEVDDEVGDERALGAADQDRGQELAEDRDEHEDRRR